MHAKVSCSLLEPPLSLFMSAMTSSMLSSPVYTCLKYALASSSTSSVFFSNMFGKRFASSSFTALNRAPNLLPASFVAPSNAFMMRSRHSRLRRPRATCASAPAFALKRCTKSRPAPTNTSPSLEMRSLIQASSRSRDICCLSASTQAIAMLTTGCVFDCSTASWRALSSFRMRARCTASVRSLASATVWKTR